MGILEENKNIEIISWILVVIAGAVKVAVVPFHVWLSKVHGESMTIGSVLLAAIALKVGYVLHVKGLAGVGSVIVTREVSGKTAYKCKSTSGILEGGKMWWIILAILIAGTVWV